MTIKSFATSAMLGALLLGLVCLQPGFTEDKPAEKKPADEEIAKKFKPLFRLPNHFGKLNLTQEQRDQVLAVRSKSGTQIAELQQKIKQLTDKRDAEERAILSGEQKEQLEKIVKQAQEKKEAKGTVSADGKTETAKPAANGSEKQEGKKKDK